MKNRMSVCLSLLCLTFCASAAPTGDALQAGFLNPPDSAKPHTWWHWMNGNVTKEGITADLEAMKRVGVGGAQIFTADCGILPGPVKFMSPEWSEMIGHAVKEAERLGVELCVHNCAGWSSSGGPWNTSENAMQRITTSEVHLAGPAKFAAELPQPATVLEFYRDIAVLAFPMPADEGVSMKEAAPIASVSSAKAVARQIADGDAQTFVRLPAPKPGQPQFGQLEFKKAFSARRAVLVVGAGKPECSGSVQVSDDGKKFRTLKSFAYGRRSNPTCTVSFGSQPVTARFWRVEFTKGAAVPLAEIELSLAAGIENVEEKAGFGGRGAVLSDNDSAEAADGSVQRRDIVDLTAKLSADGKLDWTVPAGRWIVLRVGHTPTGKNNHPAPPEGTGLECDKLSKEALDAHWAGMMKTVLTAAGPLAGKSLNNALIDSYEVGCQNWTPQLREEFQKRRGYDLLTFLPTFTGRIVDNPAVSERFLWDLRRTIADLFAENYFGHFQALCHKAGLAASIEPYGNGNFESLQAGAYADIPMGEFWVHNPMHGSLKVAASVGHIYGRPVIGAESFTAKPPQNGRWQEDPYALKAKGDSVFCQGINRYIFHRYAMQPWTNRWPGMTMGQWGSHFDRTCTWWEQGRAWLKYVARCQYLLQQGRFVADAAYFCGESAPVEMRAGDPLLPAGYDYDGVNAGVLEAASVKDGQLELKSGMRYRVLILPHEERTMTPDLLRRLRGFVAEGLTLVGAPPSASPSLVGYPQCDAEVKKLVAEMWGQADGKGVTENKLGHGKVVWGQAMDQVFAGLSAKPDFEFAEKDGAALLYIHRLVGDAELYFVSNQKDGAAQAECTFRVSGKVPELWDAETGLIVKAPVWREQDGRTTVSLSFTPAGSVFVVFREPAGKADPVVAVSQKGKEQAPVAKLEILHARYEALDGSRGADVTAKLGSLVEGGALNIRVGNSLFGDPAGGQVKQLRVKYTLNGKAGEQVVVEKGVLKIAGAGAEAPVFEVVTGTGGQILVSATAPCSVELKTASGKTLKAEARDVPKPAEVAGPWEVNFPPNWGAPAQITLDKLSSWTEHADSGVKYFSGTATYTKEFEIPAERLGANRSLWLDLGLVKNLAEVSLNGQELGILWKPPFRADITDAAKPGLNKLVVKITNLWPNRLIGDEQLPPDCEWKGLQLKEWPQWLLDGKPSPAGRLTFTTWHHWTKGDKLLESGLLGPVRLQTAELIPAK